MADHGSAPSVWRKSSYSGGGENSMCVEVVARGHSKQAVR